MNGRLSEWTAWCESNTVWKHSPFNLKEVELISHSLVKTNGKHNNLYNIITYVFLYN